MPGSLFWSRRFNSSLKVGNQRYPTLTQKSLVCKPRVTKLLSEMASSSPSLPMFISYVSRFGACSDNTHTLLNSWYLTKCRLDSGANLIFGLTNRLIFYSSHPPPPFPRISILCIWSTIQSGTDVSIEEMLLQKSSYSTAYLNNESRYGISKCAR